MNNSVKEIQDILEQGLRNDVFRTERAIAVYKEIAKYAEEINKTDRHKKLLFKYLQRLSISEAVLCTSKLYDPVGKYPTRSIHTLLDFIKDHCTDLPEIREKHNTKEELIYLNAPQFLIEKVDSDDSSEFPKYFYHYYYSLVNDFETMDLLNEIKEFRDKRIAHNERIEENVGIKWDSVIKLINIIKEVIGVLGWAYLNTVYSHKSRYILSTDAKNITSSIRRVIGIQEMPRM